MKTERKWYGVFVSNKRTGSVVHYLEVMANCRQEARRRARSRVAYNPKQYAFI